MQDGLRKHSQNLPCLITEEGEVELPWKVFIFRHKKGSNFSKFIKTYKGETQWAEGKVWPGSGWQQLTTMCGAAAQLVMHQQQHCLNDIHRITTWTEGRKAEVSQHPGKVLDTAHSPEEQLRPAPRPTVLSGCRAQLRVWCPKTLSQGSACQKCLFLVLLSAILTAVFTASFF